MAQEQMEIDPKDCPEPFWHDTHRYCPACSWTEAAPTIGIQLEAAADLLEQLAKTSGSPAVQEVAPRAVAFLRNFAALIDSERSGS